MRARVALVHTHTHSNTRTHECRALSTASWLATALCAAQSMVPDISNQHTAVCFIFIDKRTWAAHVMRMENTRTSRKITEWTPYKTRPAGRPRLRWMDQVEEDLKRMKIVGWRAKVEDRQEWNRTVEQTKTHPGL